MDLIKIDFQLLGTDISPSEISKITGIIPSVALMRGERNKARDLPRQNIWSVQSQIESDEVSDHWRGLQDRLHGNQDVIRQIAETGIARLSIIIKGGIRVPSIQIPVEMSAFAGYVGAVIDIDQLQA
ncbi:DUF4279 domain-containing protein [Chitiniphilus purpureus]|uniref:DUF4279 domain-containing protein n=1 Tax=Chitiniphilus purpureus TaxID=2981137 RepID=A0ABY6DLX2_9NEIS|nr:DUF4279 domain-containing protein [Chitiniphilus sp. CD1]UXY15342.1 DUF4279 domain-containing protein [Chitiniphilus sp. CD1]